MWNPVLSTATAIFGTFLLACAAAPREQSLSALEMGRVNPGSQEAASDLNGDMIIEAGDYLRPGKDGDGVIKLNGLKDITIDLRGVTLRGTAAGTAADRGRGIGLWIRNCDGIRVLGGTFSGYRVAMVIENSVGVTVEGSKVSGVFGQRLQTGAAAQGVSMDLALDFEPLGEVLKRFGAGIALIESLDITVRGVQCRGGQNGLIMIDCQGALIEGNDFSYLSGFGIALENSDDNRIQANLCDRISRNMGGPGSQKDHGATGILLGGASSNNLVSGNWVRGGSTALRERSEVGAVCRDNRFIGNDFSKTSSHAAVIRGSEDGWFLDNRVEDCAGVGVQVIGANGFTLTRNDFHRILGTGVLLQGGIANALGGNEFVDCDVALEIQGEGPGQPMDHWISRNTFRENVQDLVFERATGLELWQNDYQYTNPRLHLDGLSTPDGPELTAQEIWGWLADMDGELPSGRSFQSQFRKPTRQTPAVLAVAADWRVAHPIQRATASKELGAQWTMGEFGPQDSAHVRARGPAHKGLLRQVRWSATWFSLDTESDPRGDLERWRAGRFEPILRGEVSTWTTPWGEEGKARSQVPGQNFGLIASGRLQVDEGGTYTLSATADDGIRVLINGEVVLEDWAWHAERRTSKKISLEAGSHSIELEYFQLDGTAVLALDLVGPTKP